MNVVEVVVGKMVGVIVVVACTNSHVGCQVGSCMKRVAIVVCMHASSNMLAI